MRFEPGFVTTLRKQLNSLPDDVRTRLDRRGGLGVDGLLQLTSQPSGSDVLCVEKASHSDFKNHDELDSSLGRQAIDNGEVAHCILAGGLGTRAGRRKSMIRFSNNLSILGMKLFNSSVNTILMLNPTDKLAVTDSLNELSLLSSVTAIEQFESIRLTPANEASIVNGCYDLFPTGTGDLPFALSESGVTSALKTNGVKYVFVSNIDNIFANIDEHTIGGHIQSQKPVTLEVVHSIEQSDSCVCWADGRMQVVDRDVVQENLEWHNTNNIVLNIDVLDDSLTKPWKWNRVRRIDQGRIVVQFERFIHQLTEFYDTNYVKVPERRFASIQTKQDVEEIEKLFVKC